MYTAIQAQQPSHMMTPWFACRPLLPPVSPAALQEACYRLPQLRWSKRHPGKSRWVLYEMWPLEDPVTGELALLVTEQNITQVKEMEEKFCKRMGHLEEQLQDALLAAAAGHVAVDDESEEKPLIDLDSAAEKTLQLLDKLLKVRFGQGIGLLHDGCGVGCSLPTSMSLWSPFSNTATHGFHVPTPCNAWLCPAHNVLLVTLPHLTGPAGDCGGRRGAAGRHCWRQQRPPRAAVPERAAHGHHPRQQAGAGGRRQPAADAQLATDPRGE
jgi:hypothetical protein